MIVYAGDLVLIAEDEEGIRWMMKALKRYLNTEGLVLNADKRKTIWFEKRRGRKRKRKWWWKKREIEEVREITYLEYKFGRNGRQGAQVEEGIRKAMKVMGQVWRIGKRGLGEENKDVQVVGRECYRFWGGGVGIKRVGKSEEGAGKVCERGIGGGREDAGIHGEERREKGQDEDKICEEDSEVDEERLKSEEGTEWARRCWGEIKARNGRSGLEWEKLEKDFYKEGGVSVE